MSKCAFCVNNEWITEDGHRFHWCKTHSDNYGSGYDERDCEEFKPITNGERIRQMTDEELVELIFTGYGCNMCVYENLNPCSTCCKEGLTKWLKQEANDE